MYMRYHASVISRYYTLRVYSLPIGMYYILCMYIIYICIYPYIYIYIYGYMYIYIYIYIKITVLISRCVTIINKGNIPT